MGVSYPDHRPAEGAALKQKFDASLQGLDNLAERTGREVYLSKDEVLKLAGVSTNKVFADGARDADDERKSDTPPLNDSNESKSDGPIRELSSESSASRQAQGGGAQLIVSNPLKSEAGDRSANTTLD